MLLTDEAIKSLKFVTPFDESLVNPTSLDIRLGDQYTFTQGKSFPWYSLVDPLNKDSFKTETRTLTSYLLQPKEYILVSMFEHLELPDNISAKVMGKSSLARLGLDNSSAAGWIDAGWRGVITLELTNHSKNVILLTKGMKIGQLIFFKHDRVGKSYSQTGRYYNQIAGQGSLGV